MISFLSSNFICICLGKSEYSSSPFQAHQVFLDIFVRFLCPIWRVCATGRGVSHETETNRANLCLAVDCFSGDIHQYREVGPPERPQPEVRRPLAQARPPTALQRKTRPSQTQVFISLCLPNHTTTDLVTTSLRSLIAVSASLLAAWGFGTAPAHPRHPEGDSLVSNVGKTGLPLAATLRGESAPLLASFVANECFVGRTHSIVRLQT